MNITRIISTWHSGQSWCRIYSDKFCIQGGTVPTASSSNVTVQLHQTYANTDYVVMLTKFSSYTAISKQYEAAKVNSKAQSSFTISSNSDPYTMYIAFGYIP